MNQVVKKGKQLTGQRKLGKAFWAEGIARAKGEAVRPERQAVLAERALGGQG